jgi:cysteinyl-tRNA synthetase
MTIRLYDSVSRSKRPLDPLQPGKVGMYVCGPTVYDDCHVGHLMGPVVFDTVARWLQARGYQVRFVINITDIDDKIIQRALDSGEDWSTIAERYTEQYMDFLKELSVVTVTDYPRCSEYVPAMVEFIGDLVAKDMAYQASDGVYFDVSRHEGYGKLSGRKLDDTLAGARIQASEGLRHPADFALWKNAKPGEPSWESPWGAGRPGWHIECSVMSSQLLGGAFDIHGGGDDLKFPHHENEIAQSEAHGDACARHWMHNGLIQFEGRKISKSDPRMQEESFSRQFEARWLLDRFGPSAVRFFLLRTPYGRPVDFGPQALDGAQKGLIRALKLLAPVLDQESDRDLETICAVPLAENLDHARTSFCTAMDDDFNTGEAIAQLFTLARHLRDTPAEQRTPGLEVLRDLGRILGLFQPGDTGLGVGAGEGEDQALLGQVLDALLKVREAARSAGEFATADGVRDLLVAQGVEVSDSAEGVGWSLGTGESLQLEALLNGAMDLREAARKREDYATADGIRDRLGEAGVSVQDATGRSTWTIG